MKKNKSLPKEEQEFQDRIVKFEERLSELENKECDQTDEDLKTALKSVIEKSVIASESKVVFSEIENFKKLGVDIAKQNYKNENKRRRRANRPSEIVKKSFKINAMKKELIKHYKLSEKDVKRLER
jgi:hypothetical protein